MKHCDMCRTPSSCTAHESCSYDEADTAPEQWRQQCLVARIQRDEALKDAERSKAYKRVMKLENQKLKRQLVAAMEGRDITLAYPCSMYNSWAAFVDIRRDRHHEFPTYESWIISDDAECRSFRQGWEARGKVAREPGYYPDPIDFDPQNDQGHAAAEVRAEGSTKTPEERADLKNNANNHE